MENQKIVFTGGTSGLGKVAASKAVNEGAHLLVLARSESSMARLKSYLDTNYPNAKGRLDFIKTDLSNFQTVEKAVVEIRSTVDHVDQLINNAGIWHPNYRESKDGIEETLQVNVLAHYYLFDQLIDLLKASNKPRVIFSSSGLHQGTINFEDIEFKQKYDSMKVYRQSKLAVILLTRLLAERYPSIFFAAQHPGLVSTRLGRDYNWFLRGVFSLIGKSPEKGADTLYYLMTTALDDLKSGEYYTNKKIKEITEESYDLQGAKKLEDLLQEYLAKVTHTEFIAQNHTQ